MLDYPSSSLLPSKIHALYPVHHWVGRNVVLKDEEKGKLELLSLARKRFLETLRSQAGVLRRELNIKDF